MNRDNIAVLVLREINHRTLCALAGLAQTYAS